MLKQHRNQKTKLRVHMCVRGRLHKSHRYWLYSSLIIWASGVWATASVPQAWKP